MKSHQRKERHYLPVTQENKAMRVGYSTDLDLDNQNSQAFLFTNTWLLINFSISQEAKALLLEDLSSHKLITDQTTGV